VERRTRELVRPWCRWGKYRARPRQEEDWLPGDQDQEVARESAHGQEVTRECGSGQGGPGQEAEGQEVDASKAGRQGVNSKADLAHAAEALHRRIRVLAHYRLRSLKGTQTSSDDSHR
jgi:hypothetical protein